jgi:hypothetical protein
MTINAEAARSASSARARFRGCAPPPSYNRLDWIAEDGLQVRVVTAS